MDQTLIEAVKGGDLGTVNDLLDSGADPNQSDDQGWTPLNFAAGKGDLSLVKLLLERGADPFRVGRDDRTPYLIALAAAHVEVIDYLRGVEDRSDPERAKSSRSEYRYCKAYPLRDLRAFPEWSESRINWKEKRDHEKEEHSPDSEFTDENTVFIHQDFTVTQSAWHNENVIFNQVSERWAAFCSTKLRFRPLTDHDLIPASFTRI